MSRRLAAIGFTVARTARGRVARPHLSLFADRNPLDPVCRCIPYRYGVGEYVYRHDASIASYLHAYFPSNPRAVAALLRS